ncbi:MAG: hypothetical protein KJ077_24240 [Anaerolineae bacterium]|nr:hypothetical protein [Anaerolineae bacterium]
MGNLWLSAEGWKPPATVRENRFKAVQEPTSTGFRAFQRAAGGVAKVIL